MGSSSESDSSNGDKEAIAAAMRHHPPRSDEAHGGDDAVLLGLLPKRRKASPDDNLAVQKRYRTDAPAPDDTTPGGSLYGEDDRKMPRGSTRSQPHVPPPPAAADAGGALLQSSSLSATAGPLAAGGGVLLGGGRSVYADHISLHGHSLFDQMQSSSPSTAAGTGGTGSYYSGLSDSLYSSLSPAARQFLLRDQLARNQQAAMLLAQIGGGGGAASLSYGDPWLQNHNNPSTTMRLQQQQQQQAAAMAMADRASVQNFPAGVAASDMISRYASVLSGLPAQSLTEYWRGGSAGLSSSSVGVDLSLADQYSLHQQLNQLSHQQQQQQQQSSQMGHQQLQQQQQQQQHLHQLTTTSQLGQQQQQHHQLFASPLEQQRQLVDEQQQQQRRQFEAQHQMGGSPLQSPRLQREAMSAVTDSSRGEALGRLQQSPGLTFTAQQRSIELSNHPLRTGDAAAAGAQHHAEHRLVPAAAAAAAAAAILPHRMDGGDDDDVDGVDLPPCVEGLIPSLTLRRTFPLGIDEDTNWLSEFHCFVREELIEVFQASHDDVKSRNTSIAYHQIGLRCRYCAHLTGSTRAGRSSAYPSSIRQIYQSFTMMLRDHFPNCEEIRGEVGHRYTMLKDKPSQGATDSKRYWIYAGLKIGMADSKQGIYMTKETRREGLASLPFGLDPNTPWRDDTYAHVSLVSPADRKTVAEFFFLLLSQVQPIRLTEAECIGNRRSLRVGLPGLGCRYCCQQRRLGLGRIFPARRRNLLGKVLDFYDHIRRCPLCPASVQAELAAKKQIFDEKPVADQGVHRDFFDRVWTALGHEASTST